MHPFKNKIDYAGAQRRVWKPQLWFWDTRPHPHANVCAYTIHSKTNKQTYLIWSVSTSPFSISLHCWWYSNNASENVYNCETCSTCKRQSTKRTKFRWKFDSDTCAPRKLKWNENKYLHRSPANCTFPIGPNALTLRISPQHHEFHRL